MGVVNLEQHGPMLLTILTLLVLTQTAAAEFSDFSFLSKDNLCSDPNSEFMCRNKQCIPKIQRCDGVNQCSDASDEIGCDVYLCQLPHWFRCNTSEMCISSSFRCDGEIDCGDRSDEANCENFTVPVYKHQCRPDEFQCNDNFCIPLYQVCDETFDCLDHSDEVDGCTISHPCDGFRCRNHRCIPHEWRCNGANDCMDNSDEEQCENFIQPKDCTMETGHFLCKNHLNCIRLHELCDQTPNCPDKSDETSNCTDPQHSCKVKHCSHDCIQGPDGAICLCPKGYRQISDGVCQDINECEEVFGICDQKCHNLEGSYECSCDEKYELQRDAKTCKAHGGEGQLIFSTKHEIRGLFLNSGLYYEIANKLKYVVGVTSDGDHIFWTDVHSDNEAIIKADMDGGNRELLITAGLRSPEDLAIDWITKNIYFTDSEMQHIGVCSYDGIHCTIVLNKYISKPRGITLNPHKSEMFWTDWGHQPEIARAGMDGENDISFVNTNIRWPNGLTIDYPNNRLYWIDAKLNTIESIGLDGTDRRIVLNEIVRHPFSIVVFEDRLYWSDWFDHSIQSCEKFTGKNRKSLVKLTGSDVFGIHMLHSALQPKFDNPCEMARCSHLCMLSQTRGYTCACPEEHELNSDKHTCRAITKKAIMVVGAGNLLLKLHHQILGKLNIEVITQSLMSVNALAYDCLGGRIIVSDNNTKTIYAVSDDGKQIKSLIDDDIGFVEGMDFDYLSNNLYWCDSERRTLEVYSFQTKSRKSLLSNLKGDIPLNLALVPDKGVMYVAFGTPDDNIYIDRMDMDGSNDRIHVISSGLVGKKIQLIFDDKLRRVFWSCMDTNNIESTSVDGDDRHGFRALLPAPASIAILGNDLFWTNERSHRIYWADKLNINQKNKKITLDLPKNLELHLIPLPGIRVNENHPCSKHNGNCSDICLVSQNEHFLCACGLNKILTENNRTCVIQKHCDIDQYQCPSTSVCIPKTGICDKNKDCLYGEDEQNCEEEGEEDKCKFGEKQCKNGQCIPEHYWCNSHYDCYDQSDESDCNLNEQVNCSSDQFQCDDSKECIDYAAVCDHYHDCADQSDEYHCEFRTCNIREFRCATGKCIPHTWRCDGQSDCPDLSDEDDCEEFHCPSHMFMCDNKRCIDPDLVCNQENDCFDNSDEFHCTKSTSDTNLNYLICDDDEITCSGNVSYCIPETAKCNGSIDCPNGEDEFDCEFKCPENQFQCMNKKCIEESWICDKVDDCGDKSDEDITLCTTNPYRVIQSNSSSYNVSAYKMIPCVDGFRCKSGNCLDWKLVCNNKIDCDDGSDEGGACESSCENNPCQQVCVRTPSGSKCDCHRGFKLEANAKTCDEIKHCELYPPVCAQICAQVDHDYRCSCFPRYQLRLDHIGCKSLGDPPSIIFSSDSEIRKIVPHKNELHLLQHDETPPITGLDYSVKEQAIYYSISGTGAIYKLNLRNNTRHYIKYLQNPTKLSLDWVTDTIYFVEEFSAISSSIKACHLIEQKCVKILNVDTTISAFTIDPVNKYIFYSTTYWWIYDKPKSVLYKANLDGTNIHEMIHEQLEYVTGITYDIDRKLIYLTDLNRNVVERVSYNGKRRQVVFYGGNGNGNGSSVSFQHPYGLNLFEDHLYFMMPNSVMKKCRLFGKIKCLDLKLHNGRVENFVIDQESRQVALPNLCDQHKCHYLCIQSEVGVKCLCPDGDVISENGKCNLVTNSLSNWEIIQNEANSFVKITKINPDEEEETTKISFVAILFVVLILIAILSSVFFFYRRKYAGSFSPGAAFVQFQYTNPIYNMETLTTVARDPNGNVSKRNSTSSTLPLRSQESQDSGLAYNETMQDCQEFFNPMNDCDHQTIHGIPNV